MPDLAERLRAMARCEHDDHSVADEAAAEIERLTARVKELEAALRAIQDQYVADNNADYDLAECHKIANVALKEGRND